MDQKQTKQALLKKSIQILLSIFAFSILFIFSPLLPLSTHFLCSFSEKIFSYTPDRNYIFLFSNGIIAFLIMNCLSAGSALCFFHHLLGGIFRENHQMDQKKTKQASLNKSIRVLLFIFAISILFTLCPLLPLSSHFLSSISDKIFSYTPDTNYIFLFCNGIIAFLIKKKVQNEQPEPQVAEKKNFEEDPAKEENGNLIPEEEEGEDHHHQQQQESEIFLAVEEEEEEKEEEEEEDGMGLLSAEELNKKCNDFIRKMKEGIMIEAQRQIIV